MTTNNNGSYVLGNGDVTYNNGYVYGNGRKGSTDENGVIVYNDNIYPSNTTENSEVRNTDVYGYGNTVTITREILWSINGYIYTDTTELSDKIAKGNTVNGRSVSRFGYPVAIVDSSVIYCSGEDEENKITVEGNTVNGDRNVINGFRIYGSHMLVKANIITGNYNVINPNYIDEKATDIEFENEETAIITGNCNVINDPNAVVVRGTMNIFN